MFHPWNISTQLQRSLLPPRLGYAHNACMAIDIVTIAEDQIAKPASFAEEGRSETARTPDDLLKFQQIAAADVARKQRRRGISFSKLIAPGALSDNGGSDSSGGSFGSPGSYP